MARQWRTDGAYGLRQAAKGGNICPLATQRNAVGRRPLTTRNSPLGQKPCWRQSKTPGTRGTEMLKNERPNAPRIAYSRQLPDCTQIRQPRVCNGKALDSKWLHRSPANVCNEADPPVPCFLTKRLGFWFKKEGKPGENRLQDAPFQFAKQAVSHPKTGRFAM